MPPSAVVPTDGGADQAVDDGDGGGVVAAAAEAESARLKATRLHRRWGTFDDAALEREFLAERWLGACTAVRGLAIAMIVVFLSTLVLSSNAPQAGWVALTAVAVLFNAAAVAVTLLRWRARPLLNWLTFTCGNTCITVLGIVMSQTYSLETFPHPVRAHGTCGGLGAWVRWQVAHGAFFIALLNVSMLGFSRVPFVLGLPLCATGTLGLAAPLVLASRGLGAACAGFLMVYLLPATLVLGCMLIMQHGAELEQRHAFVQWRLNRQNELLAVQAQARLMASARAQAQAEASQRAHEQFVATFTHELRTPLTAIIGNIELMDRQQGTAAHGGAETDAAAAMMGKHMQRARSSSQLLLALVNNILDLSRLGAGMLVLNPATFGVREALRTVEDIVAEAADRKQLRLGFAVDGAVPEVLRGDPTRFQQVLVNLINNAIKFTPPQGTIAVEVTTVTTVAEWQLPKQQQQQQQQQLQPECQQQQAERLQQASDDREAGGAAAKNVTLRMDVRDSGVGMRPDEQERVFGMFARGENKGGAAGVDDAPGAGCGLAICKQLALLMGGDVEVVSAPGLGSTFTATLVFQQATQFSPASQWRAVCPSPEVVPAGVPKRVLLAEDNDFNAEVLAGMLHGVCSVTLATDGVEAVDAFVKAARCGKRFDCVLMDCNMPRQDGFAATRAIREFEAQEGASGAAGAVATPVIALTAHSDSSIRQQCADAGMGTFISKPVRRSELVQRVLGALGSVL
jgi:signal transduction histidine kinase/AmiR/NasT family two-component response regulator